MKITHGLLKGQVLQRDRRNKASAQISGSCTASSPVETRVRKGARDLRGFGWRPVGEAVNQEFTCQLNGLPCGGPYKIELRIPRSSGKAESLTVEDIYVGDVWFMGGQSNMQGIGLMADAPKPHPLVRCFYVRDEWGLAKDPLHFLSEAVDMVHHVLSGRAARPTDAELRRERRAMLAGVGVGVHFGAEMVRRTRVPQGLVACAHGGTSMANWSPKLKDQGGQSLYGATLRRFRKLGQPVVGFLWYQGESDAVTPEGYTERMEELVAAIRDDFGQPDLPWVVAQIGRVVSGGWAAAPWNSIQEQERRLPERIENLDVVPTIDLELDDSIHISAKSFGLLGQRMACAAEALTTGKGKGGIRLKEIRNIVILPTKREPAVSAVELTFSNVVGGLRSVGRPVGFCLANSLGEQVPAFYKVRFKGDKVILQTALGVPSLEHMTLHYGFGCDPATNIADARGMGLCVMGPVPVAPATGTAFVLKWQAAQVPGATSVREVALNDLDRIAQWSDGVICPMIEGPWLILPKALTEVRQGIFFLRSSVEAAEEIRVKLAFGSDSPFKLWCNGAEVIHDWTCTNPCFPDEYTSEVTLKQGRNDIVVAFDVRNGQGWGICARFKPLQRDGEIPKDKIKVG